MVEFMEYVGGCWLGPSWPDQLAYINLLTVSLLPTDNSINLSCPFYGDNMPINPIV